MEKLNLKCLRAPLYTQTFPRTARCARSPPLRASRGFSKPAMAWTGSAPLSDRQTAPRLAPERLQPSARRQQMAAGLCGRAPRPPGPAEGRPPRPRFIHNLNKGFNNQHRADRIYNSNAYFADVKFNTLLWTVCFPPKQLAIVLWAIERLYFSFLRRQKKSDPLLVKVKGDSTFCFCRE